MENKNLGTERLETSAKSNKHSNQFLNFSGYIFRFFDAISNKSVL